MESEKDNQSASVFQANIKKLNEADIKKLKADKDKKIKEHQIIRK